MSPSPQRGAAMRLAYTRAHDRRIFSNSLECPDEQVEYMGCVIEPPTYCLVLEFCSGRDLFHALRDPTRDFDGFWERVARGVAAGMAYLHSRNFMHRDLKSMNVLLHDDRHDVRARARG